ncbi:hypothetical protein KLEB273_gp156 [Bacillus phage vB_BauM_KLEB27-3]|nr:hypothetical protein KLEB273_gp156 [Bacillus phage vB_BauM_KLEB27-3]
MCSVKKERAHETKKEYLASSSLAHKIFYFLGCFKLIEKGYKDGSIYRYTSKARALHPFSWIFILLSFVVYGINKETFQDVKKDTVLW